MNHKQWDVKGCLIPIVTPFTDDYKVDEVGLRALIDYMIDEQSAAAIIPCGTTGESPTLSHQEHLDVIRITVDAVGGRVPVIAGTGSNSTEEAVYMTQAAKDLGVDGTLQVGPYYNKPSQEGIIRHFEKVAEATDLPIIIYNIPGRTGRNIEPDTVIKLAEIDTIVGVKDASGDILQTMKILKATLPYNFHVYAGEDALTFSLLCLGGHGAVAAVGHVIGKEVDQMVKLVHEGSIDAARNIHYKTLDVVNALFIEPNPVPVKQALAWMGLPAGPVRLPLVGMTEKGKDVLRKPLLELGKIS
ncbi:MAG TPA: 4-hydroxy-tetrahydrodipicolinate synthase [Anaerolineae bacterium]|jgi:4-hydroxy-tetrahydrodipicolinate synthase|nr:4-hydroxy-tetrahydrodipicolinate synthase [Anaerolineae bacterium]